MSSEKISLSIVSLRKHIVKAGMKHLSELRFWWNFKTSELGLNMRIDPIGLSLGPLGPQDPSALSDGGQYTINFALLENFVNLLIAVI